MDSIFSRFDAWITAATLALAMTAAWKAGWRLGAKLPLDYPSRRSWKFDDVSLALLGLLIAFTFGISPSASTTSEG
jgi:hypothetical protein